MEPDEEETALEPTPSPNPVSSTGVSPINSFGDIEPNTLLPRSQPIPESHITISAPWIEVGHRVRGWQDNSIARDLSSKSNDSGFKS